MTCRAKKQPLRVVIIGGSITGLTLAHCLDKAGIDYVLLEQHDDMLASIDGPIALQPNGCRVLDQIGVFDHVKLRTDIVAFHGGLPDGFMWTGLACASFPRWFGYPITVISRRNFPDALYTSLEGKSKVKTGVKITSISSSSTTDSPLTVTTDTGEQYTGDILVGADGIHGVTRTEMTRVADLHYPGSIPKDDDQFNFTGDYHSFVRITEPTPGDSITRVLQPGELYGFSYPEVYFMLSLNDDTTVNWFALVECPKTYTYPRISR